MCVGSSDELSPHARTWNCILVANGQNLGTALVAFETVGVFYVLGRDERAVLRDMV